MQATATDGLFTMITNSKKEGDYAMGLKIAEQMISDSAYSTTRYKGGIGYTIEMFAADEFDCCIQLCGCCDLYWARDAMAEYKRIKAELKV